MRVSRRWWRLLTTLLAGVGLVAQTAVVASAAVCERDGAGRAGREALVTQHMHGHHADGSSRHAGQDSEATHTRCLDAAMCGVVMFLEPGLLRLAPAVSAGASIALAPAWGSVTFVPELPPPRA